MTRLLADVLAVSSGTTLGAGATIARAAHAWPLLVCAAVAPVAAADEPATTSTLPAVSIVGATPLPGLDLP